jgi:hypothetical protein
VSALEDLETIATIVSGFATAALFAIVYYQTRQTQEQIKQTREQLDATNRPWLGIAEQPRVDEQDRFSVIFKNHGQAPAYDILPSLEYLGEKVDVQQVRNRPRQEDKDEQPAVLLPGEKKYHAVPITTLIEDDVIARMWEGKRVEVFILFRLHYKYANNKTGEYGAILKFRSSKDGYSHAIEHEWVDVSYKNGS